jgi:GNAT superfamily N-acetyltransferase
MRRYPSEEGDEDDVLAAGEDFVHDRYGYCYFVLNEGEVPFIHTLHTNDEYRGQGHARRHLEDVINKIRKSGHSGPIEINSAPQEDGVDGIRLAKFYKSLGLSVVGEHKDA